MIVGGAPSRAGLSGDDPVVHDAQSPHITFSVIDPETGRPVPDGERGQVVMNHISRTMFVPNNLERDTTMRVAGPEGQVGDSVSEVKPVETFGSEAVIEGVIMTTHCPNPPAAHRVWSPSTRPTPDREVITNTAGACWPRAASVARPALPT
jgi:hypothetical protein